MPDPKTSFIVGAFDQTGELAGFMVCQPQLHAEPLVLYDPRALRGLVRTLEKELKQRYGPTHYYAFAQGRVAQMAEALGLEQMPDTVFGKTVE